MLNTITRHCEREGINVSLTYDPENPRRVYHEDFSCPKSVSVNESDSDAFCTIHCEDCIFFYEMKAVVERMKPKPSKLPEKSGEHHLFGFIPMHHPDIRYHR